MKIQIRHIKTDIPESDTNQATLCFSSFFYGSLRLFRIFGAKTLKNDLEKNSIMLETPIPPKIEMAGASTKRSLTITPRKLVNEKRVNY